jgi:phosphoglycerate-specific signal transduction histidine kinase
MSDQLTIPPMVCVDCGRQIVGHYSYVGGRGPLCHWCSAPTQGAGTPPVIYGDALRQRIEALEAEVERLRQRNRELEAEVANWRHIMRDDSATLEEA